jgi:hypothetical protein
VRKDEENCRAVFDAFLHSRLPEKTRIEWNPGTNPPDYFLHLDGFTYAVEITALSLKYESGARRMVMRSLVTSLHQFAESIEDGARSAGILRGSYLLYVSKPIEDFERLRGKLALRIVGYIESTQALSSAPEETVFEQGRQRITICKTGAQKDQLAMGGPSLAKRESEAAVEVCDLLQEALAGKAYKLRHIAPPWVLVIRDAYLFAEPRLFSDCLSHLQSVADFHTVFLVSQGGGSMLYTQEKSWL